MSMLSANVEHYVLVAVLLFLIGGLTVLARRSLPRQLLGLEVMLAGIHLAFVAFDRAHPDHPVGQVMALLGTLLFVSASAIGAVLVLLLIRTAKTQMSDEGSSLRH